MEKNIFKMVIIGLRLRNLRKSVALSRMEIEKRHGISVNSLKAWEKGIIEIGIVRLTNYLKIFEQYHPFRISLDDLLDTNENYLDNIYQQRLISSLDENIINKRAILSEEINNDIGLISNIVETEMNSVISEGETLISSLINNIPFLVALKDENNCFILVNNLTAAAFGGTPADFAGKNNYDLFSSMAKKYHEDDLRVISTNTKQENIIESVKPLNRPLILLNTTKIPITIQESNKKIVLAITNIIN